MTNRDTIKESQDVIPTWIFWYGVIIVVGAPLLYGIMHLTGPDLGMKTLADGSTFDTAVFKYAIRNIAAAVVAAFALYKRSVPMLLIVFIMRFITEGGDLLDAFLFGELDTTSMLSYAGMMVFVALIPYALAIRTLWPMTR